MTELSAMKERIRVLENENLLLEEKLAEKSCHTIKTRLDGKTYSDDMRETIFTCLESNVAIDKLQKVIRTAVTTLAKRELDDFPDSHTCRVMAREMSAVSRAHVAAALESTEHTTVKFDGTTKKKVHYVASQISTNDATYTLGVNQTADGTAASYKESILKKINSVGEF